MKARRVIRRKKRRRAIKKAVERNAGKVLVLVLLVVLMAAVWLITAAGGSKEKIPQPESRTQEEPQTITITQEPEEVAATADPDNYKEPFCHMSADWGADDVEGFTPYQIPPEYKINWGKLPEVVQVYTFCLCRDYGIEYETILAMIETESGYKWDAESSVAYGYMQIIPEYHYDRMERLNVSDIRDPYGNIKVGIDYLAELLQKYGGNYDKALTAYRWGATGAYRDYFSKGQESSDYSEKVMEIADRIKEQMGGGENDGSSDAGTANRKNDTQ